MSYAESSREVVAIPWRDEQMVVAVAPEHPLAQRESIPIAAVEGQPFIGFDDDLPIQDQIDRYLREHKVTVNVTLRFDNIEMIKQAVTHGAGISIMPERVMREDMLQGRLMALRLEPAELYRPVKIVHRRRKVFNAVAHGLLDLLPGRERKIQTRRKQARLQCCSTSRGRFEICRFRVDDPCYRIPGILTSLSASAFKSRARRNALAAAVFCPLDSSARAN